jgi:hypothetical protein
MGSDCHTSGCINIPVFALEYVQVYLLDEVPAPIPVCAVHLGSEVTRMLRVNPAGVVVTE